MISYTKVCFVDIIVQYPWVKTLKSGGKMPLSDIKILVFGKHLSFCEC